MKKADYPPEARLVLIDRVAQWCFDQTNSWEYRNIGTGLAYLFWAIASPGKVVPFDATLENSGGGYDELVRILGLTKPSTALSTSTWRTEP